MHGDGVLDIAFLVDDVDAVLRRGRRAAARRWPASRTTGPTTTAASAGRRSAPTATRCTRSSRWPTTPARSCPATRSAASPPPAWACERIDHIVGNVEDGRMNDWGTYYNKVLGFHQFMTFDDKDISTEFSALRSKVMADPTGTIKFPINEPAAGKRKSQIQEYLDYNGGAGVQHIALSTRRHHPHRLACCSDNGVEFLDVPDALLRHRLGPRRRHRRGPRSDPRAEHPGRPRREGLSAADLHQAGRRPADAVLRDHPARRQRRLRQGQFQQLVRGDRARTGGAGEFVGWLVERREDVPTNDTNGEEQKASSSRRIEVNGRKQTNESPADVSRNRTCRRESLFRIPA